MRGWLFTDTNAPLVLGEVAEPTPGPGEVVVDVKAAGLCHSDVGALQDPQWLDLITSRPVVLGHEIAGVVRQVADDVTDFTVGQHVGVCPVGLLGGAPGYTRHGGFTVKHCAPAVDLVPMPSGLSFELAALGTDAGMTSYHAMVTRGEANAGMKVGVIGLGGLGQLGAQVAVLRGAKVHIAELTPVVMVIGFDDIPHGLDDLKHHRVNGRVVARIGY
jgi:propanol-preferring alcohol dehydrogenase